MPLNLHIFYMLSKYIFYITFHLLSQYNRFLYSFYNILERDLAKF